MRSLGCLPRGPSFCPWVLTKVNGPSVPDHFHRTQGELFWALCGPDKAGLGHASLASSTAWLSLPEKGGPVPQGSEIVLALSHGLPRDYSWVGVEVGLEQDGRGPRPQASRGQDR